jgi:hypothetical protein
MRFDQSHLLLFTNTLLFQKRSGSQSLENRRGGSRLRPIHQQACYRASWKSCEIHHSSPAAELCLFDISQVEIFITAQENSCKSHDAEHLLHRFAQKEMVTSAHHCLLFFSLSVFTDVTLQTCFASAIESLFELCLRIRVFPFIFLFICPCLHIYRVAPQFWPQQQQKSYLRKQSHTSDPKVTSGQSQ